MIIPFNAHIDSRGVLVAWKGARGVAHSYLERAESLAGASHYLGTGEGPDVAPAIVRDGAEVAVAFVDSHGVSLARPSETTLLFDGGTNVSACLLGDRVVVATCDSQGVRASIDGEIIELSGRPDARALRVAACGSNLLALFLVAGGLAVVRYDASTKERKEVTHPLREEARELDLCTTSTRVAVAVGYESDHVDLAVLNLDGVARERVHPSLRGGDRLTHPRVSWVKTGFVVSSWEPSTKRARIAREGREQEPFYDVESPFELVAFGDLLYCVEVLEDKVEGAALRLHVRGPELNTRRSPVSIEPEVRKVRELQRSGREFMRVLAAKQVAHGYRGGATGTVDVDAMTGELYGQSEAVTYSVSAKGPQQVHVEVHIGELGEEESTSMWRLATWVRQRWSPAVRAKAKADLEWAAEVTGEQVLSLDRTPKMLRVKLEMGDYPEPDVFMEWLRELARAQTPSGD
ncbi:MAG: hypothetical protein AB8H86_14695 [Polyangiales bacterium]